MTQIPEGPRPVPSCVLSTPPASPVRSRLWSQGLEDVLKNYYPTCDNFEQRMNMLFFDWTDHQNPRRHPEYGVQQAHPPMPETLRAPSQRSLPSSPFSPTTCGGPVYSPSFATTPQTGLASHPHELNMRNHTFVVNANLPGQKRKRRPYNKQKREEVSQTRKRGACSKCSQRHKKCTHSHSKDASFGSNPGEASTLDNVSATKAFPFVSDLASPGDAPGPVLGPGSPLTNNQRKDTSAVYRPNLELIGGTPQGPNFISGSFFPSSIHGLPQGIFDMPMPWLQDSVGAFTGSNAIGFPHDLEYDSHNGTTQPQKRTKTLDSPEQWNSIMAESGFSTVGDVG